MSALNIATRALTTNQAVLQVIGHNIANANTEGYTRQRVELQAVPGQQLGSGYFGKGVQIEAVARVGYDAFLTREANSTRSTAAADAIRADYLRSVEALFPMGEGGLGQVLNDALNAWVDVANAPNDTTARQVVLSRFDALATRIRDTMARLDEVTQGARLQASEVAREVNRLAAGIAQVNESIARVAGSGVPPNDLLDQRDRLIAQLNEKIQVTTLAADDGTLSVFVAGSLPLVLGNQAAQLEVARADVDGDRQIKLQFVQGSTRYDIPSDFIAGGQLRGLLDFINRDVVQTQAELGRVALAAAEVLNRQQRSGLNALGVAGTNLLTYAPTGLQAKPGSENTGTATMTLTVADPAALRGTDYDITYTSGSNVQIRRSSDGWFWNGTGWQASAATLPALPSTLEGLGISVTGTPAAGDRFYIRVGADAASTLRMPLSSPAELAAANRVQLALGTPNNGNATIEAVSATVTSGNWVMPTLPAALTFTAPDQFALAGFPASVTYTPGKPMEFTYTSGSDSVTVRLTLRGQPQSGDVFQLQAAPTSGAALALNGGNASAMLALRDRVLFDGTTPLSDGYVAVFSGLASRVNEAQTRATFTRAQATDAEQRRANLAGVNLDEEAARLLQFQQAYQASAKYLQTVQSIFDTLIATFR